MDQKVPSGATGPAAAKAEAAGAATPGKMEVVDGQLGRWAGGMVDAAISAGSLPVIGRLFRPLGAATAMGVWGYRLVPGLAKGVARACTVQAVTSRRRAVRAAAGVYDRALAESLVAPPTGPVGFRPVTRAPLGPMTALLLRRRYVVAAGVSYGPEPEQRLDVWRRDPQPGEPAPVLLYLPGGGWVYGSRRLQAHNMLAHLAEQGWLCLAADYRVAPRHPWPAHIHDAKRAIAWARANVADYGGDPGFLAVSGASAGGHLATLAGLTCDDPQLRPDLPPAADTSVDAVVSIYGRYDWEDRRGGERARFMAFLERVVVRRLQTAVPEVFRAASPIARVRADAPPFLVIHGEADTIIPVAQAHAFVAALRAVSRAPVIYVELPGAQHAFDLLGNSRTADTAVAVERFLQAVRHR